MQYHFKLWENFEEIHASVHMHMQVINQDPTKSKGEFEDISQVEKYEMSTEDYAKREGQQVRTVNYEYSHLSPPCMQSTY